MREVDVPLPGLPPDLDGLRILQLSDIHLSAFLSEAELARVIDAAIELRPHLAVVTGDLISRPRRSAGRLHPPAGARSKPTPACSAAWAITNATPAPKTTPTRQSARVGIRFLRSQAQPLRFGNCHAQSGGRGLPVAWPAASRYLRGAERLIVPGACNVLLSHNPDVFPVAARQGYNLVLAGHTHGGQVTVEILDQSINPARFFTPYVYGLYRRGSAAAMSRAASAPSAFPPASARLPKSPLLRLRKA